MQSLWRVLVGPPLRARDLVRQQITPVEGLPALSLDALTSVAYGPEAIIVVLAVAGAGALHLVLPITIAIVALLAILVFSYRQVIDAYPSGGGAYAVARANLGSGAGLLAAAALVVDYTLTVAVSITAGVASLASAFPGLRSATVPICLGMLAVITVLNLRGLGAAARAFLLPTLVFIFGMLAIIAIGVVHPLALHAAQPGRFLICVSRSRSIGGRLSALRISPPGPLKMSPVSLVSTVTAITWALMDRASEIARCASRENITLTGTVRTNAQRDAAEDTVAGVGGVLSITNEIVVLVDGPDT